MPDGTPQETAQAGAIANLGDVLREYMAATDQLQRTHEILQSEIVRLRAELASKDRELETRRRLASLGELAAGVAHEVRNPLGAIQLYSGLLRNQCNRNEMPDAVQLVEKIEAGIQAIEAVVQDTLALAPRDRRLRPCRIDALFERTRDASLKVLTTRAVQLACDAGGAELAVMADPDGLQRVLVNLVVNAAEVSPPQATVWLRAETRPDDRVAIAVDDEGPGLPDEVRHRIFDPFFTTKSTGTGLGLTIAHRLIDAYGGSLAADNRPDGGATFEVTLPAATPDAAADRQPDAGAQQFDAA
jgi:two-component system sensor histidine kinase HydH